MQINWEKRRSGKEDRHRERKGRGRVRLSVIVTKYPVVKIKMFVLDNFFYYLKTLSYSKIIL